MANNREERGASNPAQSAYTDTVADYSLTVEGDNIIEAVTCDSTVAVGNVVRMSGSTVVNALADSIGNSRVIGICVAKDDATTCDIQVTGFTASIFGGLSTNTKYFLSPTTPGAITTTVPTGSGEIVQPIGLAFSASVMIINITSSVTRI